LCSSSSSSASSPATAAGTADLQGRKPPIAQQDTGIGQVAYRCHNGQIVVK
jgi:hypothetical protein